MPDVPSNMYIKHQSQLSIFESPCQGPSAVQPLYHVVQYQQIQHNWSLVLGFKTSCLSQKLLFELQRPNPLPALLFLIF